MYIYDLFAFVEMSKVSSKVIEITNNEQYERFKKSHRRGIIFYGASWCKGCSQLAPLYERIANRYHGRIALAHADVEVCGLDFSKVPVFVAYRKGREINSILGADSERLREFVKGAIEFEAKKKSTQPIQQTKPPKPTTRSRDKKETKSSQANRTKKEKRK